MCANACSQATLLLVSWQADRSGKNAGRVDVRNELFHQGAQEPASHLSALLHNPMKHEPFQHLAPCTVPAVPALSPAILCAGMLVGSSATSPIVDCVVVDVETAVYAASVDAFALESALAHARFVCVKKLPVAGGTVCASTLYRHAYCVIYNGSML